jgi:autotransporter-associated beta strand protein
MVGAVPENSASFGAPNPVGDRCSDPRKGVGAKYHAKRILLTIPIATLVEVIHHYRSRTSMLLGLGLGIVTAHAQDGTWTPGSSDWNTAANWTPSTAVPTGIATLGSATVTTVTFSSSASADTLQFNTGAPAYSFDLATASVFNLSGVGIVNNSSNAVTFTTSNGGGLQFQNSSTAGTAILVTNSGGSPPLRIRARGSGPRHYELGGIFDISGLTTSTAFSGILTDGASRLGLTKTGFGTLTLTGTDTYTGATVVSAGTLEVDGVLGNTAVSVQNAALLSGRGTIGGSVTILNGGHLAPGPGAETLTVGSLPFSSGSNLD